MIENLKTTKFRTGVSIPNITDGTAWNALTTGAYCDYNNDINNSLIYGKLYNWYAINDSRKVAPVGWHVPSDSEWSILFNYLGTSTAANALKEAGTNHWTAPNTGTNTSGFTALPGGWRSTSNYSSIGTSCAFWSTTVLNSTDADSNLLLYSPSVTTTASRKYAGNSVRCIKD